MSTPDEMAERHDRILTSLAEFGLSLAANLQARAMAAEDDEMAAKLATSFQRVARAVRQTLALEAKLKRDRTLAEREDREAVDRAHQERVLARRARVRIAVQRGIWHEHRGFQAERLIDELDDCLDEAVLTDEFLDGPVDECIARIGDVLGLTGVAYADREHPPYLGVPDEDDDEDEEDDEPAETEPWRSSG